MSTKKTIAKKGKSNEEVSAGLDAVRSEVRGSSNLTPAQREQQKTRSAALGAAVAGYSVDTAVQKLTGVGLDIQKSLSAVLEKITAASQELTTINEAIEAKTDELNTLYGKEIVQESLDILLAEYDRKGQELLAMHSSNVEAFRKIEAETLERRKKDETEYDYQRGLKRRAEENAWQESLRVQGITEQSRKEAMDKAYAERDSKLLAAETELQDLRLLKVDLPNQVNAARKEGIGIASSDAKRDYGHQIELLKKEYEASARIADSTIKGLEAALLQKSNELTKVQEQLASKDGQVSQIAEKALEASSGLKALDEVRRMHENQSSNGGASPRKS